MRIIILGGKGLIGTKLVSKLRAKDHQVVAASRSTGVDALTGAGLSDAMKGADVVVDVTNSPSFADDAVMKFFETSTKNLMKAAAETGVRHFVALSVVGADRIPDSGYMRAKVAQESLIRAGRIPYTIVRATQFFEFVGAITESSVSGGEVRLPKAQIQPMAADDVAAAVMEAALSSPVNGIVDVAGPEALPMSEFARRLMLAKGDKRPVVVDGEARYYGARLNENSLTPLGQARVAATRFDRWLAVQSSSSVA